MMFQPRKHNGAVANYLELRLPEGMKTRLEGLAMASGNSIEAEALRAIEAHLLHQSRLSILALATEAKLTVATKPVVPDENNSSDSDYLDGLGANNRG